jgi:hypothetical protein
MIRYNPTLSKTGRLVRVGGAALLGLCLGLAGCKQLDLCGPKFDPDPASDWARELRVPDKKNEFWGVSNKARQIEEDLGVRGK